MTDYLKTRERATASLKKSGLPMVLTQVQSTFDEVTSKDTITATNTYDCYGIFKTITSSSKSQFFVEKLTEGTNFLSTDKIVLVSWPGVAPKVGDKITIQSADWAIMNSNNLAPGGIDIMYYLHIRQ